MKKIAFVISLFITITVFSQEPTDTIANFKLINKHVIWQKVYQVPGVSKDSLQKVLNFQFDKYSTNCRTIILFYNASIGFNLKVDVKDNKYRITLTDLMVYGDESIGNTTFDYAFSKRKGTLFRTFGSVTKGLKCLDKELQDKFKLSVTSSDDW